MAGNNPHAARPDADGRVAYVVRRHKNVPRGINLVADVALQTSAGGEHRRFARAELLAPHLMRLEIVVDVFAQPELLPRLNPHVAVGHCLAGVPVHRHAVRHQHGVAVFDADAVGADHRVSRHFHHAVGWRAGIEVIERPRLPAGLLLRQRRKRENRCEKNRQGDGGQFSHSARPIKQNEPALPSGFDFLPIAIPLLIVIAGQND